MNKDKILQVIEDKEKQYNFNDYVKNYIDEKELEEIKDTDALREYLENLNEDRSITDAEVIYYSNAMEYLGENDPSLNDSMELACDMGYELKNINSEVLASLLKSQNNGEDYQEFIDEVISELNRN